VLNRNVLRVSYHVFREIDVEVDLLVFVLQSSIDHILVFGHFFLFSIIVFLFTFLLLVFAFSFRVQASTLFFLLLLNLSFSILCFEGLKLLLAAQE
jgi:hypothetical protein